MRTPSIEHPMVASGEHFPPPRHEEWKYVTFLSELRKTAFEPAPAAVPSVDASFDSPINRIVIGGGEPFFDIAPEDRAYVRWEGGAVLPERAFDEGERADNPFIGMVEAAAGGVLRIRVPKGQKPTRPFGIFYVNVAEGARRLAVQVEWEVAEGAELVLFEESVFVGQGPGWTLRLGFGEVAEGGRMMHGTFQRAEGKHYEIFHAHTRLASGAEYRHDYFGWADRRRSRNNLHVTFEAEGAESHMNGLFIVDGSGFIDNHTRFNHRAPHCHSYEQYHGLLRDRGVGVFNGKIYVAQAAQKTDAYQSNRNVLLEGVPTMNAKPQLEIFADDVRCSHGCTVGPLDESGVFYLTSRGIRPSEARHMMATAFGREVIERMHPLWRLLAEEKLETKLSHHG